MVPGPRGGQGDPGADSVVPGPQANRARVTAHFTSRPATSTSPRSTLAQRWGDFVISLVSGTLSLFQVISATENPYLTKFGETATGLTAGALALLLKSWVFTGR